MRKSNESQSSNIINSVIRASDILVSLSDGFDTVTQISKNLSLSHATTYRLLKTLEYKGLVIQDARTRKYYLGPVIIKLNADPSISHHLLIANSIDEMTRLWKLCGETIALHVSLGNQKVCLKELQCRYELKSIIGQDIITPLYPSGMGKMLLAQISENDRKQLVETMNIVPYTSKTITDRHALLEELKKVEMQGYARSSSERVEGSLSLSVAINNYLIPAALTIVAPESRLKLQEKEILQELMTSAKRISSQLRYIVTQDNDIASAQLFNP